MDIYLYNLLTKGATLLNDMFQKYKLNMKL